MTRRLQLKSGAGDSRWISKWMRQCVLTLTMLAGVGAMGSGSVRAGSDDDPTDGRMEGYAKAVSIEKSSTTPTYLFFFTLVVVGCSVLFKSAKRNN